MLGNEEAAAMAPQEKEFLHECLRVKREREGLPTPPRSPATWSVPTPPRTPGRARGWLGGPTVRLEQVSGSSTFAPRSLREKETEEGASGLRVAVQELMTATAAIQLREKETERRVSKLEQKALSNAKVASEFQRVWSGMTTMAEKINDELKKLRARTEELERSGPSACEESSLAELSPFSVKSTVSGRRGNRFSFSPTDSDFVTDDATQREGARRGAAGKVLGDARCETRDSAVNTSVEYSNGCDDTASICSKMINNRLEEEAQRLERVECEVHQQILETRQRIDRLDSEVDSLGKHHLGPKICTKAQELQEQLNSITKDLEQELRTSTRELDLKIERCNYTCIYIYEICMKICSWKSLLEERFLLANAFSLTAFLSPARARVRLRQRRTRILFYHF